MAHPLTNPVYRRLFAAQVVSLVGTGLATVALSLFAFDLAGETGGSAGQILGTAFAIKMVAYVTVAPLAATALARLPPRSVLVAADLVRCTAAIMLPFVNQVWQVYLLVAVLQAASATFTPTFQAVVPRVLPAPGEYTAALSLARVAEDLEAVLSPVLAGALLLVVATPTLFVGTAVGFAASALLVLSVFLPKPVPHAVPDAGTNAGEGRLSFGARMLGGLTLMLRSTPLRASVVLNLAVASAGAFVLVQTVVIVRETYGFGASAVPLALASNGLGSILMAAMLPRVLAARSERTVMLSGAAILVVSMALVPVVLGARPQSGLVALCGLWALVGVGWAAAETPVGRLIQAEIPAADLPAAFAAQFSLSHACWLLTYPLAGWLGSRSLTSAAWVLAAIALVSSAVAAVMWLRAEPAAGPGAGGGGDLDASLGTDPRSVTA
ncbi:Major Facilitator Superfamily protein [Sanguibacter gelidistatuariae]|uniref:Major Facilitator Superfamily protein n=1 Tax=Sanguibacter gelidistatuariae TaxID=1814289 RepID=A0A1G6ULE2_9MICO|nr:MFS transporter [Sanguibacter gelidistatuariae]SDD42099.1 Major Facilitator Superfamily protein [Sanguibacter gelidistatuariae]